MSITKKALIDELRSRFEMLEDCAVTRHANTVDLAGSLEESES